MLGKKRTGTKVSSKKNLQKLSTKPRRNLDMRERMSAGVSEVGALASKAKEFVYLASPYSLNNTAKDEAMDRRNAQITRCCHTMMATGLNVYSPITHHHSVQNIGGKIEGSSDYWLALDFGLLKHATGLFVLMLDGWQNSIGVTREISYAREHLDIPVVFIQPDKYILTGVKNG